MSRIELRNRNKKIIGYCTVSPEHYDRLNQYKWYKNRAGYAQKTSNDGTSTLMHRFVMIEILKNKELTTSTKLVVHHIDCDRLNNQQGNLESATHAENAQKKLKSKNASSKYYGVSKITRNHKVTYRVRFRVDKNTILYAYYDNEIHAAHQFNLWYEKYGRTDNRRNNIEIPDNFVEWKKTEKNTDLPIGITRRGDKFCIQPRINGKCVFSSYDSLKKAQLELNRILHEEEIRRLKMIFITPIVRNKEDQCVIELFNIKKEKVGETVVDEDIYYLLKLFPIHLSVGKAIITANGKKMLLSRYVIDYDGNGYVDHIGTRNPLNALDNRKENLRIVDAQGNAQNRRSAEGSSSNYVGVCKIGKKWRVRIKANGKQINLGRFDNEEEAAEKRDMATIKYFGEFGHLNFPKNVYNHFAILSPRLSCLVHHLHQFCNKQIYLGDFDEKKVVENNFGEFDHLNLPENKYNDFAVLNMRLSYYLVKK